MYPGYRGVGILEMMEEFIQAKRGTLETMVLLLGPERGLTYDDSEGIRILDENTDPSISDIRRREGRWGEFAEF